MAAHVPHVVADLYGLAQAAYDFTVYLRGELPGTAGQAPHVSTKQIAVPRCIALEQTKALWFQAVSEAKPRQGQVLRAYARSSR